MAEGSGTRSGSVYLAAQDQKGLVSIKAVVVPATKGDAKSVRIYLEFTPQKNLEVHWTNVSVIKLGTYRVAARSAKRRVMSTTSPNPPPVRCSEVRFAEVDFPGVIQSRLVIEYTDGLKIIVGSHDDLHLAADLISELRCRQLEGARK